MTKKYTLRYLPLFEQDLVEARDYIELTLQNPLAARRLIEDTEAAIINRLDNPLAFKPYHLAKDRKYPYYCIRIRNYIVFYVVINDIMEVRRFIYSKRNIVELI